MSTPSKDAIEAKVFQPRHLLGWLLFSMAAGFVNASAVVSGKNVVSHISGNVTNIAVDPSQAGSFLFLVILFFVGAVASVFIYETLKESAPPAAFGLPILMSAAVLIVIAVTGKQGHFGVMGEEGESKRMFVMLGLLATTMGMVNAATAQATGNQIRITHLTGPATDLAGNVVRAVLGSGSKSEGRWALLRTSKIVAFVFGAFLAVRWLPSLRFDAFVVAAVLLVLALGFTGSVAFADDQEPTATKEPELQENDPAE